MIYSKILTKSNKNNDANLYSYAILFRMYGLFQTAFYFGYMALFSGALGMLCGTVGYVGTKHFVHRIYSTVKIDQELSFLDVGDCDGMSAWWNCWN